MACGSTWNSLFSLPFFAPLSGSVTQDLAPDSYRGSPAIERAIQAEAASFGRQLGIVSEALVVVMQRLDMIPPEAPKLRALEAGEDPVEEFRDLVAQIDTIKERYRKTALDDAERALARLRDVDRKEYDRLVADLKPRSSASGA